MSENNITPFLYTRWNANDLAGKLVIDQKYEYAGDLPNLKNLSEFSQLAQKHLCSASGIPHQSLFYTPLASHRFDITLDDAYKAFDKLLFPELKNEIINSIRLNYENGYSRQIFFQKIFRVQDNGEIYEGWELLSDIKDTVENVHKYRVHEIEKYSKGISVKDIIKAVLYDWATPEMKESLSEEDLSKAKITKLTRVFKKLDNNSRVYTSNELKIKDYVLKLDPRGTTYYRKIGLVEYYLND